jgi:hypothetical protein
MLKKTVTKIVKELKSLKASGSLSQITSTCYKNDRLKPLSKILRQDYFKYMPP